MLHLTNQCLITNGICLIKRGLQHMDYMLITQHYTMLFLNYSQSADDYINLRKDLHVFCFVIQDCPCETPKATSSFYVSSILRVGCHNRVLLRHLTPLNVHVTPSAIIWGTIFSPPGWQMPPWPIFFQRSQLGIGWSPIDMGDQPILS